ncbi:MAG: plasmid maintenance system antidote protein [Prevotella sp.]|jgi:plasmid maintenance system antidote protein VapI|nr:plasmid maintenance system antidote protein [Prevotella sp.]
MDPIIDIIKGIHPGIFLDRELKKRKMTKSRFALSIDEYPQSLVAITKGKRRMNPGLALKIENALNFEEGFFMILQVYYDMARIKKEKYRDYHPDLTKINPTLFWDTKIENIDWVKNKRSVIRRVFERGNEQEKAEIFRFYGKDTINEALNFYNDIKPSVRDKANKFLSEV